jgi:uncharacterized protein (DUF2062 family)
MPKVNSAVAASKKTMQVTVAALKYHFLRLDVSRNTECSVLVAIALGVGFGWFPLQITLNDMQELG